MNRNKMQKSRKFLIIGKNSFIGYALYTVLKHDSKRIITTSREKKGNHYFDLSLNEEYFYIFNEKFDSVFFSAAVTSQAECEAYPERAYFLNVDQTSKYIQKLLDKGSYVLFPSTNLVLPCKNKKEDISTKLEPHNLYSSMKAEVENRFIGHPNFLSIRIPKVISSSVPIIKNWIDKINKKEEIFAYTDLYLNPISEHYLAKALANIMHNPSPGILQIAGDRELSYYQLAEELIRKLGSSISLLKPLKVPKNSGIATPAHPMLDASRMFSVYGVAPENFELMLSEILNTNNKNIRI